MDSSTAARINFALGLALILVSLAVGMIGYRYFEGLSWLRSFGHAAMILGGMGPYAEPVDDSGKIFEGIYAIYCGLLLIGVTGLILSPVFHRVMHQLHLPDDDDTDARQAKPQTESKGQAVASSLPRWGGMELRSVS